MTWHWLICTSLLAPPLVAATVSGRVQLDDSREPAVRRKLDYSGVVVWLEPSARGTPTAPARARMVQKDKMFMPHVLAVSVGSTVEFPNYDPIFHNAFSNYDGQVFDIGLYPPGTSRSVTFSRPGTVRVFCNIHADMSAVIVVVPAAWFATSAHDGSFEIHDVPPGQYQLHVFHERATEATLNSLARAVNVSGAAQELPVLSISESGYLAIPHGNKYGHAYPPAGGDGIFYPPARK